jgi:hypothetical protein
MRSQTRTALIALLLLVVVGGALSWAFEENAEPIRETSFSHGSCQQDGVTLVIDFGTSSTLEPIIRCAENFQGKGWDIFSATEIEVEGTKQYPAGFVCRISGFPDPEIQDCQDTPQYSEGSWGYYLLDDQGNWRVSGVGSLQRSAECGLGEGWRFVEPGESVGEVAPRVKLERRYCD